ncbi:type II secretion system protein GspM [uncultured Helicobacter sp.]|uniref:type II secretion system protein GspM n=1 Tax=uncultured Helicobacter sp. TaxID=175537 RepID=UPI00374F8A4F
MSRFTNLKPRERLLAFVCAVLVFLLCAHIFLIEPLEQTHSHISTLLAQLQEDNALHESNYTQALHTTNTLQSQQTQVLTNLIQANASLHSMLHEIYTNGYNAFESLDSILTLSQDSRLTLTDIKIANEKLGIISLKGSGTFEDIAQFIYNIEMLQRQYVSLDFVHIALENALEFELLVQDMRI